MLQIDVQGMTCGHCVRAIEQAIKTADTQADVQVELASGRVQVQTSLAPEAVLSLIRDEGYAARPV